MKQPYNTTIYNTALYMRLSRDDENYGDSVSIETQRTILQQYAKEQGLHVVGEYVDDGWSGTKFERPDFQRMMDDMEAGKVNCIALRVPVILLPLYTGSVRVTDEYASTSICVSDDNC